MKTVSVETASKLRDAGLPQEIIKGNYFYHSDFEGSIFIVNRIVEGEDERLVITECGWGFNILQPSYTSSELINKDKMFWLPTLDDLLEWLEGRGYYPEVSKENDRDYWCGLNKLDSEGEKSEILHATFIAGSYVEAVALNVLWVLEKEARARCGGLSSGGLL